MDHFLVIDKVQSLCQGRPPSLRYNESNVPMVFMDDFEEFEAFHGTSFSALAGQARPVLCHHISQLRMYTRLCVIMEQVHSCIYKKRNAGLSNKPAAYADDTDLWRDLRRWKDSVPAHLSTFPDHRSTGQPPLPNTLAIM